MNGQKARGMPTVDLSIKSQDEIALQERIQEEEQRVIPQSEMFKQGEGDEKKEKKPKKKLSEKQLEALKRGREKSVETRKAKALEKKEKDNEWKQKRQDEELRVSPKMEMKVEEQSSFEATPPSQQNTPMPTMPSKQSFHIDYDKIISGVSSHLDSARLQREQKEHEVADNIAKYEDSIREDERNRLYAELDTIEEEETKEKNKKTTMNAFHKPKAVDYSYAFQGGRSRQGNRY